MSRDPWSMPNIDDLREMFEARVHRIPDCECWLWGGAIHKSGYGSLTIRDGPGASAGHLQLKAHRLSFMLHNGPLDADLVIMHSCDVKWCVNPAHLSQVPQAENLRDMFHKGRVVSAGSKKTACPRGHAYDEKNTYRHDGQRHCIACRAINQKIRDARPS